MDRKHPRRARLSIQMTGGMIAMVLLLVVLIYLMNRLFLSGFYLKDKQNTLKEAFTVIDEAADNTRLYTEDFKYTLEQLCANSNLSDLVNALNNIGVTPLDLIAILQALAQAGSLQAEIEII